MIAALRSAPLLWLIASAALFSVEVGFATRYGEDIPRSTQTLWLLSSGFALAWWVRLDKRVRRFDASFDFEAFVFFGWALVMPYYLWRTRGLRGVIAGFGIVALYFLPVLVALAVCFDCEP